MSRALFEFDLNQGGCRNPPPAPSARMDLFAGLQPSETANRQSTDVAKDFMRRLGVVEDIRPLHVTLDGLGCHDRFSIMDLAAKKEELSSVVFEPFMLTFDQILSFHQPYDKKALVLCCSQPNPYLLELQQKIADAQNQPGIEDATTRTSTPHMTLFYTHQAVLRQRLDAPVRWLVRDFHILWSHTGDCKHESLWRWPPST